MAADQSLLELSLEPTLRVYSWSADPSGKRPVSIGYLDPWESVPIDRSFVRRWTGGGLVDHQCDFTYSIVLPQEKLNRSEFSINESYLFFHKLLAGVLIEAGIAVRLASEKDCLHKAGACFARPVLNDLLAADSLTKIAGAAQRRNRYGLLHQGSVLGKPWTAYEKKMLAQRLAEVLSMALNLDLKISSLNPDEIKLAELWCLNRYEKVEWNRKH